MITFLTDQDLYKFSVSYAYMKLYPEAEGIFNFCDRNNTILNEDFVDKLRIEIANLSLINLTQVEKRWCIKHIPYIPEVYWEWLSGFRFDSRKVLVWLDSKNHLHIKVTDYLYKVTLYEVPILAVNDKTFAIRLREFIKSTQVNDAASDEEKHYLLTVAQALIDYQIKTATDGCELKYLKNIKDLIYN